MPNVHIMSRREIILAWIQHPICMWKGHVWWTDIRRTGFGFELCGLACDSEGGRVTIIGFGSAHWMSKWCVFHVGWGKCDYRRLEGWRIEVFGWKWNNLVSAKDKLDLQNAA